MYKIIIVDDLQENLELYKDLLEGTYEVILLQDPLELLPTLEETKVDMIILDIHMPKMNGFELFVKVRQNYPFVPIIFLTSDLTEDTSIKGLNLGVDDFIVKPISVKQLIARIGNKILKNKELKKQQDIISYDGFSINLETHTVEIDGKKISLTPIEYKIIQLLAKKPNKIFPREYIVEYIWPNTHIQEQNIDTHFSNLRRKLKPFSTHIKTIKTRGYILRI